MEKGFTSLRGFYQFKWMTFAVKHAQPYFNGSYKLFCQPWSGSSPFFTLKISLCIHDPVKHISYTWTVQNFDQEAGAALYHEQYVLFTYHTE